MPITPLTADQLRRTCDPAQFTFATTAELDVSHEVPGQRRASEAIEFGVEMRQPGYNLFVIGRPGVGRRTLVERVLRDRPPPDGKVRDWCYVNNFADPQRPIVLGLPAGRGARLRDDLAQWVRELREEIPAAFDTDEYRDRVGRIDTEFNERQHHGFEAIGERARQHGPKDCRHQVREGDGAKPAGGLRQLPREPAHCGAVHPAPDCRDRVAIPVVAKRTHGQGPGCASQ